MKTWAPIRTMPENETVATCVMRDGEPLILERRLRREGRRYYPPNTSSIWVEQPPTHWRYE